MTTNLRCGARRCAGRVLAGVLMASLLVLTGCDRTPSGEGDWEVTIEGPGGPFGAAAVVVSGDGVLDVVGNSGTRVWSQEVEEGEFRAVIIQPAPSGSADFRVRVREVGDPAPSVTVLQLADMDDEPVPVTASHTPRYRR